jgi:hypothetical protein
MQPSQTIALSGNYTPPAGQPAIISLSPPIGPMTGGTVMTINGVNFTTPATVQIGGQPAINVAVQSATQITCSTPSSSVYGSTNVIVQTTGGSATNQNGFAYGIANGNKLNLVSAVGGGCYAVDVSGSYAYVGEGRNLVVLNVSTQSNPFRAGSVLLPGIVSDIKVFGNYAYVADGEAGLQVIDVSTPSSPKICGYSLISNNVAANGITITGGRAYVADVNNGLEIFDLTTPAIPSLISLTACTNGSACSIVTKTSANGVFAYVVTGSGMQIIDVSNPYSPSLRGFVATGATYYIALAGNYVYAANQGGNYALDIIDISNTNAPVIVGTAPNIIYPLSIATANNVVYAISSIPGLGFYTFNISGSSLVQAGNASQIRGGNGKMVIAGNYAYVASPADGSLKIISIANTYSPSLASSFTDGGQFGFFENLGVSGNLLCTVNNICQVYDITTPGSPQIAGQLNSQYDSYFCAAGNGKAYVISNACISVVDITTPTSPHQVASIPSSAVQFIQGLCLSGSRLYAAGTSPDNRFVAFDVSNPLNPQLLGTKSFTDSFGVGMLAVNGNKAVVGGNVLRVLDISNISSPQQVGILTNVPISQLAISPDGNYVYSTGNGQNQNLTVISIANPSNPQIITNIPIETSQPYNPWWMTVRGNELVVSIWNGVFVYDISTPAAPVKMRSYFMNGCYGVCAPSDSVNQNNIIYVADSVGGIVSLLEQDLQSPDVYITDPIFGSTWPTTASSTELGGSSDDNVGVTAITWSNNRGGSGQISPPLDNWYVPSIALYPGTNILTVTAYDAAGNSGTDSLAVIYQTANQNQTITFPAIANHTFGDPAITLDAAASSGLLVSFSVVSGPATLTSSNVLTLNGAGIVTVQASQPGNSSYNPASSTNVSFNVSRANQSIAFAPVPNHSAGDAPFALAATTSSGLPVYFNILSGPAINSNNIVTLLGGGAVTAIAWQPGNSNYNAAATVQQSFAVSLVPQSISFGALSPQRAGDAPFPLNATASSGLQVNFSILSGPANLSGNILTLTGWGTVVVRASQAGNNIYAAAANVDQPLTVTPPNNTIGAAQFTNGGFQMSFYGTVGSNYTLQASTDLKQWISLLNFTCSNTPTIVVDGAAKNYSKRFYRIAQGTLVIPITLGFNSPHPLSANGFLLTLQGPVGSNYVIQVSTNLLSWQPLTNFVSTNATMYFLDSSATNYKMRFYRAVRQ